MSIKPIRTQQDYENTLLRIDELMDSLPNTQEFDELDILVTLVEAYEEKHYKIDAPDAISAILFRMEQENLKQKDLIIYVISNLSILLLTLLYFLLKNYKIY